MKELGVLCIARDARTLVLDQCLGGVLRKIGLPLVMVMVAYGIGVANATTDARGVADQVASSTVTHEAGLRWRADASLERRLRLLTEELGLDTIQQTKMRLLLEGQRQKISRVWSDTATPAAVRVSTTQAIGARTADQIRALLNDEQRKKYNPARAHDVADASKPNVESWINSSQTR